MASTQRTTSDSLAVLEEALPSARHASFFGVVRLLERLVNEEYRIGTARSPTEELIRFLHDPGLTFSSGDIKEASLGQERNIGENGQISEREIVRITTTFLGLAGGVSPLPAYFSDEIAREDPYAPHQRQFLDIFHHRLLSLFYRSSERYSLPNEYNSEAKDLWSKRTLLLGGNDGDSHTPADLPKWQLLQLTPLLATQVRSASSLERCLVTVLRSELPEISVKVSQFLGGWTNIGESQRIRLGVANVDLGRSTFLGQRIYDSASRVRVTISPVTKNHSHRLMADGDLFQLIATVFESFCAEPLEYQLELILADDAIPSTQLSGESPVSFLGKNTWLGQQAQESRHYIDSN